MAPTVPLNCPARAALIRVLHGERPMSYVDEIRHDPAAWLARARAEPEDVLCADPLMSLSLADVESLEVDVSSSGPRRDGPILTAGSAAMGAAEPLPGPAVAGGARVTGGRTGALMGGREAGSERARRAGR